MGLNKFFLSKIATQFPYIGRFLRLATEVILYDPYMIKLKGTNGEFRRDVLEFFLDIWNGFSLAKDRKRTLNLITSEPTHYSSGKDDYANKAEVKELLYKLKERLEEKGCNLEVEIKLLATTP